MDKKTLIANIAKRMGATAAVGEKWMMACFGELLNAIVENDKVELRGFGVFKTKSTKARPGRNPFTGLPVEFKARRKILFRPGKELKKRANEWNSVSVNKNV